jgi:hypothetical protein
MPVLTNSDDFRAVDFDLRQLEASQWERCLLPDVIMTFIDQDQPCLAKECKHAKTVQWQTTAMSTEWHVNEHDFPHGGTPASRIKFALHYASLAPSNRNSQPWRFIPSGGGVVILADRSRAVSVVDPFDRELTISCGAALMNLRVAMAHFGMRVGIETFPAQAGPDVLAHVTLNPHGHLEEDLAPLFPALTSRATNRSAFSHEAIPLSIQATLIEDAIAEDTEIVLLAKDEGREAISALVERANHALLADPRYRRELAAWSHPQRAYDGIPMSALGIPQVMDFAEPAGGTTSTASEVAQTIVAEEARKLHDAPLLMCLCTRKDWRNDWLLAGQALERILLRSSLAGLDASFFNQVLEVDETRMALRQSLGGLKIPQIVARLGKGASIGHTPRRPLDYAMR